MQIDWPKHMSKDGDFFTWRAEYMCISKAPLRINFELIKKLLCSKAMYGLLNKVCNTFSTSMISRRSWAACVI